jgi:type II secretory pathway pseudopilin PulG
MSRVIACANCGAKFKLPDSFTSPKAKCKSCGAVIEIESSIVSADAPATPKPAAPKATPRASTGAASEERPARSSRAGGRAGARGSKVGAGRARRGRQADGEEEAASPRRGAGARRGAAAGRGGARAGRGRGRAAADEAPEGNKTGLYLGVGGGLVAIIAVVLFFVLSGQKEEPKQPEQNQQTAQNQKEQQQPAKQDEASKKDEQTASTEESNTPAKVDETTKEDPKKETPAKEATAKKDDSSPKTSAFDAKTLSELEWAPDTTSAQKEEIKKLIEKALEPGMSGVRALRKLESEDFARHAFPAIVNRLRTFNYFNGEQAALAYSFHKTLEKITLGRNAGYKPPMDEYADVPEEDAYWNAKCVKPWHRMWESQFMSGDLDAWEQFMAKRKDKQDG